MRLLTAIAPPCHFWFVALLQSGTRKNAAELVALASDLILASGGTVVGPLLQATRSVPNVFTQTPDLVGAGFVISLARPGGKATEFTTSEYGISEWLELLKRSRGESLERQSLCHYSPGIGQFASIQSVAPSLAVELTPLELRDANEIERDVRRADRVAA